MIVQMEVWNDSAEWLLVRAGLAEALKATRGAALRSSHARPLRLLRHHAAAGLPLARRRRRLAVYLGFNIEHFAFGEGLGAALGPDVARARRAQLLLARIRQPRRRLALPGAVRRAELPTRRADQHRAVRPLPRAGRGLRRARRRADRPRPHQCRAAGRAGRSGRTRAARCAAASASQQAAASAPAGWLSPWISESRVTPDLLAETGYRYTLNWCHDDQPVRMRTRSGEALWSIPYPQELNDIPMIVARQMDAEDFAAHDRRQLRRDAARSRSAQPLVMGIALHPYLVGQPYRLRHLRRALEHIARSAQEGSGSPRRARSATTPPA